MQVTIYHNPACGTSRTVLGLIREAGVEPQVIEYLKTPPDGHTLTELVARAGVPVRALMRRKGTSYDALELDDPKWTDAQLIDWIVKEPSLLNRPIVVRGQTARLCRPVETVKELLG